MGASPSFPQTPEQRRIALIAGVFFAITFLASIPALLLYEPLLKHSGYVLGAGADTRVALGAVLEVALIVANIATAVVLYPIVRRQSQSVSLGTSGTAFAFSSGPAVDPQGEAAAFCDSTTGWLPLICTLGCTVATEWVRELFGPEWLGRVLTNVNPDEVVAIGAAVQANSLAGHGREGELLLLDVIALSLGIETMGGLVERIVERNTTIPVAKAQDFTTFKDGQTAMAIHVVQGERDRVEHCRSLARFELRGIPPMAAGAARIRVTFQVDADGLLSVEAKELTSGVEAAVTVKPSYGLADDDIARMLSEGFATAEQDMRERSLRESRVEAERMLLATQAALAVAGDLLDGAEREAIGKLMSDLQSLPLCARVSPRAKSWRSWDSSPLPSPMKYATPSP